MPGKDFFPVRDWAPRDHSGVTLEQHMSRMATFKTKDQTKWWSLYLNPVITGCAAGGIIMFIIFGAVWKEDFQKETKRCQDWVTDVWNWIYMISQNIWILILLYVLAKYYNLRLGKDHETPEFSDATYFTMIFSCGVATGLFYFTAEPMWHYTASSARWATMDADQRATHALMVTYFHWGFHGWVPYVAVGAVIALLTYRRGYPMSMRFALYPLIGEMSYGLLGDIIEVLSILCTIFGVCTSLGLGAGQILAGLKRLDQGKWRGEATNGIEGSIGIHTDGDKGLLNKALIIIVITGLATCSVVAGLKAGIAFLSQLAFILSLWLLLAILFLDDTWYVLNMFSQSFGYYLWYILRISFHTDATQELGSAAVQDGGADGPGAKGWMNGWTIFYWGWWISWGPFVGTFLARISRGRKLGEFIVLCLILPTLWSCVFMGIFGAAQIRIENQARAAGLTSAQPYGHLADKNVVGTWMECTPNSSGVITNCYKGLDGHYTPRYWNAVDDATTRLSALGTNDVIFEHIAYYGGSGWSSFFTTMTLITIVLYFVTSSDSASFVVDIMAANGNDDPPLIQRISWASLEGICAAILVLTADPENPGAALSALQSVPIVLGLPFTFLLFWICHSLLILCREEAGEVPLIRKNFKIFHINGESASFVSFVAPFLPLGDVAFRAWGGSRGKWQMRFALPWVIFITFMCLGFSDWAFAVCGAAMLPLVGLMVAGVRVGVRYKMGIDGDVISDVMVGFFLMPFAIGQMIVEDLENGDADQDKSEKHNLVAPVHSADETPKPEAKPEAA